MRMMHQVLPPGVQQGEKPDACPQVTWIPSDRLQCFGDGLKQDCVDRSLILKCNGAELSRQREDDVKVRDRQQFTGTGLHPVGLTSSLEGLERAP